MFPIPFTNKFITMTEPIMDPELELIWAKQFAQEILENPENYVDED